MEQKPIKEQSEKGSNIPYMTHPAETAVIVAMMTEDEEVITAALLHDVIEDAGITEEEIKDKFGARVASLVQQKAKISQRAGKRERALQ